MSNLLKKGISLKKSQVTIFIIMAIVIIAGVSLFFLLKDRVRIDEIPQEFKPIEQHFLSCIETKTLAGISLLQEQGGYIYLPDFEPGSRFSPTSNYLNFLGTNIPYWHYVSGNNIQKQQVPSVSSMEEQLENYLKENLNCDFSKYRQQGFEVFLGDISPYVDIKENQVEVKIKSTLQSSFGDKNIEIREHKKKVSSNLGKFYNEAKKIYNKEKQNYFLENYTLDVLYSYAPVTGVELSCSPKVWAVPEIESDLKQALQENIVMLRKAGTYSGRNKYFNLDFSSKQDIQFLYSQNWPTKIEIAEEQDSMLVAKPVGNQQGLGILGFCYVSYHHVYDLTFPVMIQIYSEDSSEIFQFPVSVIIDNNNPGQKTGSSILGQETELCKYPNTEVSVYTYNTNLEPVEADISFKCFNEICDIGKTQINNNDASLTTLFPQCINGFIFAESENYETKKVQYSTNFPGSADIILNKLYNLSINLKQADSDISIISFESEDTSKTIAYPQQKQVKLTEGYYNITVQVYKNSSIYLEGKTRKECVEVPKPGILGFFGSTTEKCFDLNIPSQTISNALTGGGRKQQYLTQTELEKENIEISFSQLPVPSDLEQLQKNYELAETSSLNIEFK